MRHQSRVRRQDRCERALLFIAVRMQTIAANGCLEAYYFRARWLGIFAVSGFWCGLS